MPLRRAAGEEEKLELRGVGVGGPPSSAGCTPSGLRVGLPWAPVTAGLSSLKPHWASWLLSALPQVPTRGAGSAQPGPQDLLGAGGAAAPQRGSLAGAGPAGAVRRLPARTGLLPET